MAERNLDELSSEATYLYHEIRRIKGRIFPDQAYPWDKNPVLYLQLSDIQMHVEWVIQFLSTAEGKQYSKSLTMAIAGAVGNARISLDLIGGMNGVDVIHWNDP